MGLAKHYYTSQEILNERERAFFGLIPKVKTTTVKVKKVKKPNILTDKGLRELFGL